MLSGCVVVLLFISVDHLLVMLNLLLMVKALTTERSSKKWNTGSSTIKETPPRKWKSMYDVSGSVLSHTASVPSQPNRSKTPTLSLMCKTPCSFLAPVLRQCVVMAYGAMWCASHCIRLILIRTYNYWYTPVANRHALYIFFSSFIALLFFSEMSVDSQWFQLSCLNCLNILYLS